MDPRTAERTVVFTTVDGLRDSDSQQLIAAGVPVVVATAMTLEEISPLATELGLRHAMIVEAGGAIARWRGDRWELEPCGLPADALLDAIREIEDRSGASLFVDPTPRAFSVPFVIESGNANAVERAAASLGLTIRRDERFLYLVRACDEEEAMTRLREEFCCVVT